MGLELEDYMQEELEGLGVPHKMGLDLELEDYRQEEIEVGFEVLHMLDWGLALVGCKQEELEE